MEILTSQLIFEEIKPLQTRQFDDFGRNWPCTKSRQNSEKREMVNWFTMVLFDGEIRIQDQIVEILTSQLICVEMKVLQIRQFDDSGGNWPYTRSR